MAYVRTVKTKSGARAVQIVHSSHRGLDGPGAVVYIRNHLVHPKRLQEDVYKNQGLTRDAWLLVRHYVNLLILFSIGYDGSFARLLPPWGWAGTVEPVPWTVGVPAAAQRRSRDRRRKRPKPKN